VEAPDVETSSDAYARRFAGPVGEWFLDVQARTALELLSPWPGSTVLDVGGGHGQLTGPLVAAGHAVTVYGSAAECRLRVEGWIASGTARFQSGDLLRTSFPDRTFDAVVCFRLLPHVAAWRRLVAELCRVARHAVVLDYPSARSVNAAAGPLFGLKKGVEGDTRPFEVFRDRDVRAAFDAEGFRRAARRAQFLLPMALHRGLGSQRLSRALEAPAAALGLTRALGSPVIARFDRRG